MTQGQCLATHPLRIASLFPDSVIAKEEEEIGHHDDKYYSVSSHKKSNRYHPYPQSAMQTQESNKKTGPPAWKQLGSHGPYRQGRGNASILLPKIPLPYLILTNAINKAIKFL